MKWAFGLVAVTTFLASATAQGLTLFPYCNCDHSLCSSSYYVLPQFYHTPPSTYEFTLGIHPCFRSGNGCCAADLDKFEIAAFASCAIDTTASATLTLPGPSFQPVATRTPEFYHPSSAAPGLYNFKIDGLGLSYANISGAKIAITLLTGCTTLLELCSTGNYSIGPGVCEIALFSSDLHCCPVSPTGMSFPPPPPPLPSPPPSPAPSPPPSPQPSQIPPPCVVCIKVAVCGSQVSADTCAAMATAAASLYLKGVALATPFTCSTYSDTSATVCGYATTDAEAATFLSNFNTSLVNLGPPFAGMNSKCIPGMCTPRITATTCDTCLVQEVECSSAPAPAAVPSPVFACITTAPAIPFSLSPAVTESAYGLVAGKAATLYTFSVITGTGSGAEALKSIASKIEFYLDQASWPLVLGSLVNGVFVGPSWGSPDLQPNTYKVHLTNFATGSTGLSSTSAAGTTVGILIDSTTTLSALSAQHPQHLHYAIFSAGKQSCPVGFISSTI